MSLRDLNRRHLGLICRYSSRYAIRGGTGLVFFMLVLFCGLMIAHMIVTPVEQLRKHAAGEGFQMDNERAVEELLEVARPAVEWAIGSGGETVAPAAPAPADADADNESAVEWARFLLDERPALLSAVLLILAFAMPFLVAVGAFNQLSGDIQTRGLRYHLLRTERANIFFGRFLGTAIFTTILVAVLIAVIVLYLGFKVKIYAWGDLMLWGAQGVLALAVISLPYVALGSWISAAFDSPFGSLVINKLVIGVVPLFSLIGRHSWDPLRYINYTLPWGIQNYLLHHDGLVVVGSVAACLGYTAVFLGLGYRHFANRDL